MTTEAFKKAVGLTGGIASGKSTVSHIFRSLGAQVIDADILARQVVEPGKPAWQEIVHSFGKDILLPDGQIDRKKLGAIVFQDPVKREVLNQIVHPRVFEEKNRIYQDLRRKYPEALIIVDAALLIEAGSYKRLSKLIVVYVDEQTQLRRLMLRDGISAEEAWLRIRSQMPLSEKVKYADYVIDNRGSLEETRRQVEEVYKKLMGGGTGGQVPPSSTALGSP
jgi:dephospho-CoA kinase